MPSPRAIVALIFLALLVALVGGAVWQQSRIDTAKEQTRQAQALIWTLEGERDTAIAERDTARNNVRVVTQYVDRVQVVRVAGETITREIPVYVTQKADAACAVPVGFLRIHDAAAANQAPGDATGDPDAPAAGITLSGIAGTLAHNYTQYHLLAAQLTAAQDYIRTSCYGP